MIKTLKLFRKLYLLCIGLFLGTFASAQDIEYARHIVDTLSSPAFEGRGYVGNGDTVAARFIAGEFRKYGLTPFDRDFYQRYSFPMNTFPGKMEAKINGIPIPAGNGFQVWAASPSVKGTYKVFTLTQKILKSPLKLAKLSLKDLSDTYILIDKKGIEDKSVLSFIDSLKYTNYLQAKGFIFISDQKMVWSVMMGYQQRKYTVIDIRREYLPNNPKEIYLDIDASFVKYYHTMNVAAYIKGAVQPDSFLVLTAHYDHLGRMGNSVFYPGANDNATGTSMVMNLASWYANSSEKPYYSIAFILLSGEEAGLKGSNYCADHPLFNLQKVKFLINIDMVGTGSEGITMVNATRYPEAYKRMSKINADNEYILSVKERGESCNSDHCPFYKKGVPAIFLYSIGKEYSEYHNPDDKYEGLPFSEYQDIFRLVRDFLNSTPSW